jgi:c-di-AMP phosphodiesterase-like protein
MNILFESAITESVRQKYILLPLDTFYFQSADRTEVAYGLIENTPILEMMAVDRYKDLHHKLIENYQKQNWSFCENAIEHLTGKWSNEIDSFYSELSTRIVSLKETTPQEWTSTIYRP